ncbi:MAG: hypothetical protein QNK23_13280 [Crocinitomicaceae bacterium]|nr:hypothetical protein [Crocinitomicaceae bacterium]
MASKQEQHIKFIIVDAINDDIRGLYELNYALDPFYPKIDHEIELHKKNVLINLIREGLISLVRMSDPKFEEIERFDNEESMLILSNRDNWALADRDWLYGIVSNDYDKTIALENELYKEINT